MQGKVKSMVRESVIIELCANELSSWRPPEIWMHASEALKSEAHPKGAEGLRPIHRWMTDKVMEEGGSFEKNSRVSEGDTCSG